MIARHMFLGDDCASSKVCHWRRSVSNWYDKTRDQTLEKVFPKVLSTKLFFEV